MSKTFRPYEPDQMFLMPASIREWLPGHHLVYFLSDVVDHLDLSAIVKPYTDEERGYPPYHPIMMVKVLLYAYCIGVASSRKIAGRLEEDIAFRVLAANDTPDFRTISDFRKDHLKALSGLFLQVLKLCQKAGLVKLGHVSLDGTKIKANASKHKAMSYKRMKEEEARLESEISKLLQEGVAVDEAEDRRYGKDKRGDELPRELAFRQSRLKKIREAKEALEADAKREAAEQAKKEDQPAASVPSDKRQAKPMIDRVRDNTGKLPRQMSADAGYFSAEAVQVLTADGVDVYMPPDKTQHGFKLPPAPRGRIPKELALPDRMRRKLRTKKGRRCYGLRKELSEPVFGQIKQARGFRQFLLRGKEKVGNEWRLICTGHNLLKLFGAWNEGLVTTV